MNDLHLFAGAGGGAWAGRLIGLRTLGYVEYNDFCQRVIAQRIRDGIFDNAPIFGNIEAFLDHGYAAAYQGLVDVVSGGFPCQPFANGGRRLADADERNMWPATIATIRAVQPRYCFLENVPALLAYPYFGIILGELAESGFDVEWDVFSACEMGAPHLRERLYIMAHANGQRGNGGWVGEGGAIGARWGEAAQRTHSGITREGSVLPEIWQAGPGDILRVADGLADRGHRITALGNGWVPCVAAFAWRALKSRFE